MDLFQVKAEKKKLQNGAFLFLGTSGYSFPDWLSVFYPTRIARKDWLKYYALKFNSVEINSTYYSVLTSRSAAKMADSVPEGFSFSVKLHSSMTHSRDAKDDQWKAFHSMLDPFIQSGKMGMVLAQFPWSFPLEEKSFSYLSDLAGNLKGLKTAVEFRHSRWYAAEPAGRVREIGLIPASVDLPLLSGLPETGIMTETDTVYLRLHGRNAGKWWGNTQERYDYFYKAEEMEDLAEKLRNLSNGVRSCYVFFNNCHMGKAALNAEDMKRLLEGSNGGPV
jgi:uncharacterized protein YecE (DUF72 family)